MKKVLFTLIALGWSVMGLWAQNFTVTAPTAGQSYAGCQDLTVSFTKTAAASTSQMVEISFNEGRTYFEIARLTTTAGAGSASITIPTPNKPTTKARVRVRDVATTAGAGAMAANFTITPSLSVVPFVISTPATLTTYPVASTQRIIWSGPADRNYALSYSLSATSGFLPIANVTGRNYYDWNIPSQSSRLYLRVQDQAEPCRVAYSDTLFRSNATVPAIGLTDFNGGETVVAGQSYTVNWKTSAITTDTVIISLSTDNGATWTVLSDSTQTTGPFNWDVPAVSTTQALFRIQEKANPAVQDISNGTFTIQNKFLTLVNKSIAAVQAGCQNYDVQFNTSGTTGFYQVFLTTNGGQCWYQLTSVVNLPTSGLNSITVIFPTVNSNSARLLVTDEFNPNLRDTTNAFSIVAGTGSISITSPTTGQFVNAGQTIPITWTTTGTVPTVDLAYSKDGGFSYVTFATGIANTGSANWTAPTGQNSNDYVIRVSSSTLSCVQAITNTFQVSNAGVVGILFPIGGEQFLNGQIQTIRWEAAGLAGSNQVTLSFSANGGTTYTPIATVPNTGSYNWTVPATATTQGRIRVADAANPVFAQASSPGNFQIIVNNPPLVSPGTTVFITLPANAVTLLGNATDPENGPLRYEWTQVSGPSTPVLANATTKTLSASPLVVGTYVFKLTALDNYDASASTNFTVKVNPAPPVISTAWNWIRSGSSSGNDRGNRVVADASGNAYVVGGINGPANFGGVTDVTTAGGMDVFVAKYDSTGQQVWIRTLGSAIDDEGKAITFLPNGNLAITGWYNRSISIPGTTITTRGTQDVFLASITPAGDWVWLKSAGSTGVDQGSGIAVAANEIYVSGYLTGNGLFGALPTTSIGGADAFIAKYDLNGNAVWVRTVGSTTGDQGLGVSALSLGGLSGAVLCGYVNGPVSIGGTTFPSLGGTDAFAYSLQSDGSIVGFRRFGGTGNDQANQVLIGPDPVQGLANPLTYLVGSFSNSMALPGGVTLTSAGSEDGFVVAFDLFGNSPLAFRLGGTASDGVWDIALTNTYMWLTGYVSNRQTNGPASFGAIDIFVSRHTLTGTRLQILQAGGISVDYGQGIAPSTSGSVFVTGKYKFSSKFGPYEIGGLGNEELFLGRITNAPLINFRQGDPEFTWTSATAKPTLRLMPNPAVGGNQIQIELSGIASETNTANMQVLDIAGRVVHTQAAALYEGKLAETLAAPLEAGIYLLRVEAEGQAPVTSRFTVQ